MGCVGLKVFQIYSKGPLNYLSPSLLKLLLQRSIFDILCDIWFIPTITLYLSAMMKPFLYDVSPMEAKKMIDELPHDQMKKVIFKKGLLHLLPEKVNQTLKNNYQESKLAKERMPQNENQGSNGSTRSDEQAKNHLDDSSFSLGSAKDISEDYRFDKRYDSDNDFGEEMKKVENPKADPVIENSTSNNHLSSEIIHVTDDVNHTMTKEETKNIEEQINLEEEIVDDQMVKAEAIDSLNLDEPFSFKVIPISTSPGFKGSSDPGAENSNYFDLLNLETVVLTSNRDELIGQQRTILNHQQLSTLGCIVTAQGKGTKFKFSTIFNSNEIPEEDVFWDNFYIFKKKQEEINKNIASDAEDSDCESVPQKPMKIGTILKDPQSLLKMILHKKFRKIRRRLMFINSVGGLSLMIVLFLVQLKYSKRFRAYSKGLAHFLLFVITLLGMGGSSYVIYQFIFGKKKTSRKESDKNLPNRMIKD